MMDRLELMKQDAFRILDEARKTHFEHHDMAAAVVLFSGGNDSTVLAHFMRHHATHFAHCNTGIGVEATRQFVRDNVEAWGMPLLEFAPSPGDRFEDLVADQGFPGPAHHFKMYQRLKERQLRKVRRALVTNPRKERVLFIAGRRRAESSRRQDIPEHEREGSVVWVSPLANWSNDDMQAYRDAYANTLDPVPHNEVTDHLHMSAECLCGAFAKPGEYDLLNFFFPEVTAEIDRLADVARCNGVPEQRCQWGWGAYRDLPDEEQLESGPLCSSCDWRKEQLSLFG
jgi:3'-phosphoadenosine 5'-phosphosulfate sulfotransferase (PAPS reductase)/FAD synthetase